MMKLLVRTCMISVVLAAGAGALPAQKANSNTKSDNRKKLASMDGTAITEAQVRTEASEELYALELQTLKNKAQSAQKEYKALEKALERIIEEKLLQAEASKRGVSKDELIAEEVTAKVSKATAEEVDRFYELNKGRIRGSKEQVSEQIETYLDEQQEKSLRTDLIGRLEREHKIVRTLEPFRTNIDTAGRPSLGPASAPVSLVLFSDFECPYCKDYNEALKDVLKNYGERVRLVFMQFPLDMHPNAKRAAEASLCANAQKSFWQMHDLMFKNQSRLGVRDLKDGAGLIGLDTAAFNTCLDSGRYSGDVRRDLRTGAAAGVDGTPALFVNGRFLYGNYPYEDIAAIIDEELKKK